MSTRIRVRLDSVVVPPGADDRLAAAAMTDALVAAGLPTELSRTVAGRVVADLLSVADRALPSERDRR